MKTARFAENEKAKLVDFNRLATFPRDALETLIDAAIDGGDSFSGGNVAKTGPTTVSIEPAVLFRDGRLHTTGPAAVPQSFLGVLPSLGNQRWVAVLLQAQTVATETEARDFRVVGTISPPVYQPQEFSTVEWRQALIATQLGDSAPSPTQPVVIAGNTVIAWVLLSSTEIVSVQMASENRLVRLRGLRDRTNEFDEWRNSAEPAIDGIKNDIAKLNAASKGNIDRNFIGSMLEQLARVTEAVGIPEDASFARTSYFLDGRDTDVGNVVHTAKVEEGVRFSDDNASTAALQLETPGDTRFVVTPNGFLFPTYSERVLISILGKDSEVAVSNAGSQTISYVLKTVSRKRIRYGTPRTLCINSQWWDTGRYDSRAGIFQRAGETFKVEFAHNNVSGQAGHEYYRITQMWEDTYEEPYWDALTVNSSYVGNVSANTFLMQASTWVTKIKLGISRRDASGDARLLLCETYENGSPNYGAVLAAVTVTAENIKIYPTMTDFPVGPVYLEGGKRYAWALITAGNHWLAMVEGNKYAQGTFFTSTDGLWSQGNLAQDACFQVMGALFSVPRLVVPLVGWNLSGGIADIDLLLGQIAPKGTSITFEIQVGATWVPIRAPNSATEDIPLIGLPASVNARMTLVGTTNLMPGIRPAASWRTLSRPRTSVVHISKPVTVPTAVVEIRVVATLESFVEANHDCVAQLLHGAGYGTTKSANAVADVTLPTGAIRRTWTFTGVSITTWKVRTNMATVSALNIYLIAEQTEISFPT